MAIVEVKVPQLSESVAEATLLQWKKKPGDAVAMDEILIEVETDKVVLEVPAPAAGVMAQIVCDDGATVTSGQLLALLEEGAVAARASRWRPTPSIRPRPPASQAWRPLSRPAEPPRSSQSTPPRRRPPPAARGAGHWSRSPRSAP